MKHILIFGDSNTWGFDADTYDPATGAVRRIPYEARYPGLVQALLGDGYRVIEEGLNSRTLVMEDPYDPSRQGLAALRMLLEAHAPLDLVVLHLGVNELKEHFNLSAGAIAKGMKRLIAAARTPAYGYPAPQVLVLAPPPVPEGIATAMFGDEFGPHAAEKSRALAAAYQKQADLAGCAFLDCAGLGFSFCRRDCLHYIREDHAKLAPALAAKIAELLA